MASFIAFEYISATFNVDSFDELRNRVESLPPSLLEYHLDLLFSYCNDEHSTGLNRSQIEYTISLDNYQIYLDYNKDYFIEKSMIDDPYETESLW